MTSTADASPRVDVAPAAPPKRLRDTMTAEHLLAAVRAMHPQTQPKAFVAEWWDGAALVPALLVTVDGRRVRAVTGPTGEITLLPRSSWLARRRLAKLRRSVADLPAGAAVVERPHVALTPGGLPKTPLIYDVVSRRAKPVREGRPGPRPPTRAAAEIDYRSCTHIGCGAIVPLPERGVDPPCPRCGRR
jgi:hypothetical protein